MYSKDDIKELIDLVNENDLSLIELEDEKGKIKIEKKSSECVIGPNFAGAFPQEAPIAPVAVSADKNAEENKNQNQRTINSPMVGVFYAAPSPDSDPYVSVGDTVSEGDTVCIIEAMKLMNEITAEESGVIEKILVKNGDVIEYNQPLFVIK
ncbi:MAG: acetyl-CoA carboxylase biotin carboxyl carrier protein [Acutalibacteraceae bacterium]